MPKLSRLTVASATPPCAPVVELLESLLADAKAGRISSMAYVALSADQADCSKGWAWGESPDVVTMFGAIEIMKLNLFGEFGPAKDR